MKDEDKTFENERQFMKEVDIRADKIKENSDSLDVTFITDQYRDELKKYMERESIYIKTENQLKGTKQIVIEMSKTIRELSNENKFITEHNLTQAKEIDRLNEYVQILELEKKK